MRSQTLEYAAGAETCEAYIAWDETGSGPRPGVLVSHAWGGQGDLERAKADALAKLGYIGFALDLFGKGIRGGSMEENAQLIKPFVEDRALLRARMLASLDALKGVEGVDSDRIGAIGYCFGGLCVLDLARAAAPGVRGVVSVHGLLHPPRLGEQKPVESKVLILHGYDDPMAKPDSLVAVADEFTAAGADWQILAFGGTSHAFTNPNASSPDHGLIYNPVAHRRADAAMETFLAEALV